MSYRTKDRKPRRSDFPLPLRFRHLPIAIGNAVLIAAAVSLLVVAENFHDEYAEAHWAAYRGSRIVRHASCTS